MNKDKSTTKMVAEGQLSVRMAVLEKRKHRRLEFRMPVDFRKVGEPAVHGRASTRNISTGGLYFETTLTDLHVGDKFEFELTVPPGEGYFPYQGRVTGVGEVVRTCKLEPITAGVERIGVGARFRETLKLSF